MGLRGGCSSILAIAAISYENIQYFYLIKDILFFLLRCCINIGVAKFVLFPLDLSTFFCRIGHGFSTHQAQPTRAFGFLVILTPRATAAQSVACNGIFGFQ